MSRATACRATSPVRPTRDGRADLGGTRGSATTEIAVALPALAVVVSAALWGVVVAAAQIACVDGVRAGARAAARGEPQAAVRSEVLRAAPRGAQVRVQRDRGFTRVEVRVTMRPPLGGGLPGLVLRERAVAATEPGVVAT